MGRNAMGKDLMGKIAELADCLKTQRDLIDGILDGFTDGTHNGRHVEELERMSPELLSMAGSLERFARHAKDMWKAEAELRGQSRSSGGST
jgi:hypothetical protein